MLAYPTAVRMRGCNEDVGKGMEEFKDLSCTHVMSTLCFQVQGCGPGSATERTRTTITAGLRKKLKDLMGE